jgi:hypothetical protein
MTAKSGMTDRYYHDQNYIINFFLRLRDLPDFATYTGDLPNKFTLARSQWLRLHGHVFLWHPIGGLHDHFLAVCTQETCIEKVSHHAGNWRAPNIVLGHYYSIGNMQYIPMERMTFIKKFSLSLPYYST